MRAGASRTAEELVRLGPPRSATDAKKKIVAAIDAAAARLSNTRSVCRRQRCSCSSDGGM